MPLSTNERRGSSALHLGNSECVNVLGRDLDCTLSAAAAAAVGSLARLGKSSRDSDPGGGEMILSVDFFKTTYKKAPHRFEAGTPDISGPIGLHAAMDYLDTLGRENIFKHDQELATRACEGLARFKGIRLFGPKSGRAGLVSFLLKDIHAHDAVTVADQRGVALRGGHHCTQPLMRKLGVDSTARASFYFYNTNAEVDRFIEVMQEVQKFFTS